MHPFSFTQNHHPHKAHCSRNSLKEHPVLKANERLPWCSYSLRCALYSAVSKVSSNGYIPAYSLFTSCSYKKIQPSSFYEMHTKTK